MESPPFSPIFKKIAAEVGSSSKRKSTRPTSTEVCLEEWWLSKPKKGKGLAVSGRTIEIANKGCDNAQQKFQSPPSKKRNALREFHSAEIVKRHGCTTLETSDGFIISLCGFINKIRTQQNGFPIEVCRDFIFGFPCNWEDCAASVGDESSEANLVEYSENLLPSALDACSDVKIHELVLSMSDTERDLFNKKVLDNLIETLTPQSMQVYESSPAKSTRSRVDNTGLSLDSLSESVSKKRRRMMI